MICVCIRARLRWPYINTFCCPCDARPACIFAVYRFVVSFICTYTYQRIYTLFLRARAIDAFQRARESSATTTTTTTGSMLSAAAIRPLKRKVNISQTYISDCRHTSPTHEEQHTWLLLCSLVSLVVLICVYMYVKCTPTPRFAHHTAKQKKQKTYGIYTYLVNVCMYMDMVWTSVRIMSYLPESRVVFSSNLQARSWHARTALRSGASRQHNSTNACRIQY